MSTKPPIVQAKPKMLPTQSWNSTKLTGPARRPTITDNPILARFPAMMAATPATPASRRSDAELPERTTTISAMASAGPRLEHDGVMSTQNGDPDPGESRI